MPQTPVSPNESTHGNKYVTAGLLLAIAAGLFVATVTHLVF